ncbi:MAG: GNAT family N-acetyltransferase [Candidatus Dormibacteria bacterium]
MTPALRFRPLTPADRARALQITEGVWDGNDYLPRVFDDWVADPEALFIGVESEGRLAGFHRMREVSPGEWWFEGLRVDESARGQGLARALMTTGLAEVRARGARSVRMATGDTNQASLHLAAAGGFREAFRAAWVRGDATEGEPLAPIGAGRGPGAWDLAISSPVVAGQGGLVTMGWSGVPLTRDLFDGWVADGCVFGAADALAVVLPRRTPVDEHWLALAAGEPGQLEALVRDLRRGRAPFLGGLARRVQSEVFVAAGYTVSDDEVVFLAMDLGDAG